MTGRTSPPEQALPLLPELGSSLPPSSATGAAGLPPQNRPRWLSPPRAATVARSHAGMSGDTIPPPPNLVAGPSRAARRRGTKPAAAASLRWLTPKAPPQARNADLPSTQVPERRPRRGAPSSSALGALVAPSRGRRPAATVDPFRPDTCPPPPYRHAPDHNPPPTSAQSSATWLVPVAIARHFMLARTHHVKARSEIQIGSALPPQTSWVLDSTSLPPSSPRPGGGRSSAARSLLHSAMAITRRLASAVA
jgi:hypothetical protein